MFSGIHSVVKNMKVKTKLVMIYLIAGLVPVIAIVLATSIQFRRVLRENGKNNLESYLYQATESMDNNMQIYNNLINYVSYNQSISQVLSSEYTSMYERYNNFVTTIDPLLSSIMYFHNEVESVTVYMNDVVKHGSTLAPISEIENEKWFEEIKDNIGVSWFVQKDNGVVYSFSRMAMMERYGVEAYLCITIDYDKFFSPLDDSIMNNYGVVISGKYNECIYSKAVFDKKYEKYVLGYDEYKQNFELPGDGYTIITRNIGKTNWQVGIYKPDKLLIKSVQPIITIAVFATVLSIISVFVAVNSISKLVTRRLGRLEKNMKDVEHGSFKVEIKDDLEDEIGELNRSFMKMINKINELINEVYDSKLKEKEYEMKALQAQINPHFLYNTLSMINWKAIEAGAMDISKITLALSTFYRTSLNKGKNVMSIKDEIDNMKSYLSIQLMMHDNEFDAVVDIDDEILKYTTLNLILQPLIENAIDHGIDVNEERRGVITITGKSEGDEIVLSVADNGVGMDEIQAQKILTKDSKGYGVRNVNERIKLFYGEQYHLHVESKIGEGTKVSARFPKI